MLYYNIRSKKALTLTELLVSLMIVGFLIIALANIDIFSRHHVLSADKRTQIQNALAYVLEHMNKHVSMAVGNELINSADSVANVSGNVLRVFVDYNGNGRLDPEPTDRWIAYRLNVNSLEFCSPCPDAACNCGLAWTQLSNKITSFIPSKAAASRLTKNSIDVSLTACDTTSPYPCGTSENPRQTMQSTLGMPLVSVN